MKGHGYEPTHYRTGRPGTQVPRILSDAPSGAKPGPWRGGSPDTPSEVALQD